MPVPTLHTTLLPWAKLPMLQKNKMLGEQELPCTNADRSQSCPEQGSAVGGETGQNCLYPTLQTGMDSIFTQSMEPRGTEAPFPRASGSRCVRNTLRCPRAAGLLRTSLCGVCHPELRSVRPGGCCTHSLAQGTPDSPKRFKKKREIKTMFPFLELGEEGGAKAKTFLNDRKNNEMGPKCIHTTKIIRDKRCSSFSPSLLWKQTEFDPERVPVRYHDPQRGTVSHSEVP